MKNILKYFVAVSVITFSAATHAERLYPAEQRAGTIGDYYPAPQYHDTESHPLRIVSYILHPIGWVFREALFRPVSYVMSGSDTLAGIFGYKKDYSMKRDSCLLKGDYKCGDILPYKITPKPEAAVVDAVPVPPVPAAEIFFPNVNFDFNARVLNDAGKAKAKEIATILEGNGSVAVTLEGNTDYIGSDKYNEKLGLDRAEALKAELIAQGVAADRLSTVSFGESKPLVPEKTKYARSMNRRVEVKVK